MFAPLLTSRSCFRHIVFADELSSSRRAVNLARQDLGPSETAAAALSDEQRQFLHWLFARGGLDAGIYREETLARRLPACLRGLRVACVADARDLLESQPLLIQRALDAVLIGVTSFFRDPSVFDALQGQVLPILLEGGRRELRVWSAGCSDGAELYSFAMLLDECDCLDTSVLVGTDCRPAAIRAASDGLFPASAVGGLTRQRQERYFVPGEKGLRVRSPMRVLPRWRTADVLGTTDHSAWDVILCRNLAMYLTGDAMNQLWQKLYGALRPGGFLVLGKAERPTGGLFTPILPCVYRRDTDARG